MRIFNFGSLNIDHVYRVDHIVRPGETIASLDYNIFAGGKGANQSIAVARAGGTVFHVGKIGKDGVWMIEDMKNDGVIIENIAISDNASGHAIIQVDAHGQNSIVICGGTNKEITRTDIRTVLSKADKNDIALLQNEINDIPFIINEAADAGLTVCFNPAPMDLAVLGYPLEKVSFFIINESEGEALTGKNRPQDSIMGMRTKYPSARIVLTRGAEGVTYADEHETFEIPGINVDAVDTTAAGDTFIGYMLSGIQKGNSIADSLEYANRAAAVSVTRKGATVSIPYASELI